MIGKRVKELRKEWDISQEQLGKAIGITTSAVGMYETEVRQPSYDVLQKIADYFKVSTDYLMGRTEVRAVNKVPGQVTKAYHNLDTAGLPEEAVQQVEEYIEFIKQKYNPDGTRKGKGGR